MSSALTSFSVLDAEEIDSEALKKLRPESVKSPVQVNGTHPGIVQGDPRLASITSASKLDIRPAPEMVSTGIPVIDALTGGLPRGCLTEICGPASSGRTTLLLSALAAATRRGEFCVVVDASDAFDPYSAIAAGVQLEKLLWVRCGEDLPQRQSGAKKNNLHKNRPASSARIESQQRLEQVLRATDLLLDSGGFGLIVLDLGDLPAQAARYIPLTTWFRFRRTVEHTPLVLLAIEQQPIAGSCSSLLLKLGSQEDPARESNFDSRPSHSQLLTGMAITAELLRTRPERKPARSASISFSSKTAWAG
ncbi:MAG: hypothetical protein WB729_14030 [Candidatus Sulfotelmatobacter sp.]